MFYLHLYFENHLLPLSRYCVYLSNDQKDYFDSVLLRGERVYIHCICLKSLLILFVIQNNFCPLETQGVVCFFSYE